MVGSRREECGKSVFDWYPFEFEMMVKGEKGPREVWLAKGGLRAGLAN
jgi:hypothetical protein